MVRTLPTFLMKKAKQQVPFPLESGWRARLPTSSQTCYKVTIIFSITHKPLSEHDVPRLQIDSFIIYTQAHTPRSAHAIINNCVVLQEWGYLDTFLTPWCGTQAWRTRHSTTATPPCWTRRSMEPSTTLLRCWMWGESWPRGLNTLLDDKFTITNFQPKRSSGY